MLMLKSFAIFLLAAVCEVGGGYLVWLWLREGKSAWIGVCGGALLVLYGVVATWQVEGFARVYAAYGGIFIAVSIAWAMALDGFKPDIWDIIGGCLALAGAWVIMFAPR
ncbi:hypothetical protein BKN38_06100 [Helicobacter sp. CLO-3]|nr:hypothetical protein BA723_06840 [Helicobacter sp. CLO-3]OHU82927.1 hypothetical protein BKN38_06100 [Helicobacter sp. CLO-3]